MLPTNHTVTDHSWTVFSLIFIAGLVLSAAYCVWQVYGPPMETLPPVIVEAAALPKPSFVSSPQGRGQFRPVGTSMFTGAPSLPMADQPVAWKDLTLMLRAGLGDADIIDALRGKQLVVAIGPTQAATLRELGAGDRLLNYLQACRLYSVPTAVPNIVTPRPAFLASVAVQTAPALPLPTPVDYAARDRQIKNLQSQIDSIDAQIMQIRNRPGERWQWGIYDGPNNRYDDGSAMKKVLDRLDQQRNDLRREKWKLEGR